MDDTLATMTPSAQLEPLHALAHAMPDPRGVVDSGKAARRAAQQPHTGKEAPGSKAHLVRYEGVRRCLRQERQVLYQRPSPQAGQ
eukprot:2535363-Pleurochrysis_carterae.AAC.1